MQQMILNNGECVRVSGVNVSNDEEVLHEIAGGIVDAVPDHVYGTLTVDSHRRQITAKMHDGRTLRATVIIE